MEERLTLNQLIEKLNAFAKTYGNWDVAALGVAGVNNELVHLVNLEKITEDGQVERENLGISYIPENILNYTHGIKNISILSLEEYEKFKKNIPIIDDCWFLKTKGDNPYFVCQVDEKLKVHTTCYHSCQLVGIRPSLVLKYSLHKTMDVEDVKNFEIGSRIKIGKYSFTILNIDNDDMFVLCDEIVTHRCFDPDTNEWDKSELKCWLKTEGIQKIIK